jgi:1,4-dihydroxy-2-naphthoyl-CoA hydrolase
MDVIEGIGQAGGLGGLAQRLGIQLTEATAERVVGTMPVEGNTQAYGVLHGGASCALAETLGSIGAGLYAMRTHGRLPVGVELNATHHRSARHGVVTGVATPVHLGTSIATYEIIITDADGQRVCTSRLTCYLRSAERVFPDAAADSSPGAP